MNWRMAVACLLTLASLAGPRAVAQQSDANLFSDMRWRLIGPYRAGRVSAVAGVPGNPAVYYAGTPDGGLWKTNNGGTTWVPSSASIPVSSIGMVAVAASDPNIVYVGTGHNLLGSGVYKSTDAGSTWQHVGLDDTKYITGLLVDPRDSNIVLAGVGSGGNFGSMVFYNNNPSAARGVHRSTDGGRTWTHPLFVDENSGVIDLVCDPALPRIVFASLTAPARASAPAPAPAGPAIYRSDDEGATWRRLTTQGFPPTAATANIAVAPATQARRLYALVGGGAGGVFRSDDAGATWTPTTSRIASGSGHIYVDPKNPDVVYLMGTSLYRSTDAGRTFASYKGAPGGDDDREFWIDPQNPRRMIIGADQGATISVDDGMTWTPWYNLPNGELYFVSTDNQFPYWVYAAQQDSGTVAIKSRSDFGAIRPNDWYPVSGYEQGHIFADPFNPRYVYSHGNGHAVIRFDRDTGQSGPIYTPREQDRFGPRPGMEMSRKDPHWLYVGAQYVLATGDRGVTWKQISPDLTVRPDQAEPAVPAAGGGGRGGRGGRGGAGGAPANNGTIVAIATSPLDVNLLWVGTSNGLIHLTRDGGTTWTNVSPPRLVAESTLTLWSMEASAHDAGAAYATAIDLSDQHGPCIFRTTDFGQSWQIIVQGLPTNVPTRVVREDPERSNLLYGGNQSGAWVSFDRGDHWQSLQLNLPTAAVNDITVHGDDLVIATWGRALWILDDVTPLRQMESARASTDAAYLFAPATATRVRWDNNQDTPLPPEVPMGRNPPDGAIIDYYLPRDAAGAFTLSILDASGDLVREYSGAAPPTDTSMPNVPMYWFKAPLVLARTAGMHRVGWDLRYPTPPSLNYGPDGNPAYSTSYGIIAAAVVGESPRQQPVGPLALPGAYQVRLTANGRTSTRALTVKSDPRVDIPAQDLARALEWQRGLAAGITISHDAIEQIRALRQAVSERVAGVVAQKPELASAIQAFDRSAASMISAFAASRSLAQSLSSLEFADMKLNDSTVTALQAGCTRADDSLARYRVWLQQDVLVLNAALTAAQVAILPAPVAPSGRACGRVQMP